MFKKNMKLEIKKYFITGIIFLLVIFIFSGCYDAREIDELAYVLAIGIDKGIKDSYRLTVKFHTMKEAQGSGGGNGGDGTSSGEYQIMTIDAPSFFTGVNMLNSAISRKLNFMHSKVLVFSEEIAREGVSEYIAPIIRFRQIRRTLHVVVSTCKASEFLQEYEPVMGTSLSKAMELAVTESWDTGYFLHLTLNNFYNGLKSTYRQPLAILGGINKFQEFIEEGPEYEMSGTLKNEYYAGQLPRKGGEKIEYYGTAIFNGDKMVAELTGEETRIMNIIKGDFRKGNFTIADPIDKKLIVPLDVRMQRNPKTKVTIIDGKPNIKVKIQLEGDILAIQSRINYEEYPLKELLQNEFIKDVKSRAYSLVKKCQQLDCDALEFGKAVSSKFYTLDEWQNFNWIKQFKDANIDIDVDFNIRRTETMLKSSPIITTEGAK